MYYYISPLISLIYFVKNYTREAQLKGIFGTQPDKKIASGFKPFLAFAKSSILAIRLSPEYATLSIEK